MYFLLMFLILTPPLESGDLPWDMNRVASENFRLTDDSLLALETGDQNIVYEYTLSGEEKQVYQASPDHFIASYAYIDHYELVIILQVNPKKFMELAIQKDLNPEIDLKPAYSMKAIDRISGDELGPVVFLNDQEEVLPSYFDYLFGDDGRIFAHFQHNPETGKGILREVELVPYGKGYALQIASTGFDDISPLEGGDKLTQRWCAVEGRKIHVVNQIQPVIKTFRLTNQGKRPSYDELPTIQPNLKDWRHAYTFSTNGKSWGEWLASFSRNTGFYRIPDGYILGYTAPASRHTHFVEKEAESKSHYLFVLYLQRMDKKGNAIGEPMPYPGAHFLGVQNGDAIILKPGEGRYSISRINL